MEFKPFDYQKLMIDYMVRHKSCGMFAGMGLGKTVATLTAVQILRDEYLDAARVLVIAPKRVALDTWPNELERWDHLRNLTYSVVMGTVKERERALAKKAAIYITSRDQVCWLVAHFGVRWPFDMVVVDELSSFKNPSAKRFKALRKVLPAVDRVIGLTGTPKPNSYLDLWSQLFLLDRGERLGRTVTSYRNKYFSCQTWGGFASYTLLPGRDRIISDLISDICLSLPAEQYLTLEAPTVVDHLVRLSDKDMKAYKTMEKDYIAEIAGSEITASSGGVLAGKLLQLANGAAYDGSGGYAVLHNSKIEALKEIAERGDNLLVFYQFRSDLERIKKAIPWARSIDELEAIRDWNAGKVPILLAHPASAGHGLNLQRGGHVIVWFGLTWSLEFYQQANARLQRTGQTEPVVIYRLLSKGTADERVASVLEGKGYSQRALLEALMEGVSRDN